MVLEKKVELERMTYPEIQEAIKESNGVVVIPVGATEQHGPHLPLNTDTRSTMEPVMRAATVASVVVAPIIPWGNSIQSMSFPGTISLRNETLRELVKDIARSLCEHGFNKIVIVNGHGGNIDPLNSAAEELKHEKGVFVCTVKCWELAEIKGPPGTPDYDGHGGSQETAIMLYLSPSDVDQTKYADSAPKVDLGRYGTEWPPLYGPMDRAVNVFLDARECVEKGHFGDPKFASKERGKKVIDAWSTALSEVLIAIKTGKFTYVRH